MTDLDSSSGEELIEACSNGLIDEVNSIITENPNSVNYTDEVNFIIEQINLQ